MKAGLHLRKQRVAHLHALRHLCGVLHHQPLDFAEFRVVHHLAGVAQHHALQGIEFGLRATRMQKVRGMVVVLVLRAGQQSHGANAQLAQFAAGGQTGAHVFQINVPAACQWFAPKQSAVQIEQVPAASLDDGID